MLGLNHLKKQDKVPVYVMDESGNEKLAKRYCSIVGGAEVGHVQRILGLDIRNYSLTIKINGNSKGVEENKIVQVLGVNYRVDRTITTPDQSQALVRKDYDAFTSTTIAMLIRG